jgi:thiamine-phosphate pyrophosphorylase
MICLLSNPDDSIKNEIAVVKELMTAFPLLHFHLRKPQADIEQVKSYLSNFEAIHLARMVVHTTPYKTEKPILGFHCKESKQDNKLIYFSTSFHKLENALKNQAFYSCFFCSPLFPSISKEGYLPTENWDIKLTSTEFQSKAIALGGIDLENLKKCAEKGFKNIGLLGTIWQNPNPLRTFEEISNQWEELVQSV